MAAAINHNAQPWDAWFQAQWEQSSKIDKIFVITSALEIISGLSWVLAACIAPGSMAVSGFGEMFGLMLIELTILTPLYLIQGERNPIRAQAPDRPPA